MMPRSSPRLQTAAAATATAATATADAGPPENDMAPPRHEQEADLLAFETSQHIKKLLTEHTAAKHGPEGLRLWMGSIELMLKERMRSDGRTRDRFSLSVGKTILCTNSSELHDKLYDVLLNPNVERQVDGVEIVGHGEQEQVRARKGYKTHSTERVLLC